MDAALYTPSPYDAAEALPTTLAPAKIWGKYIPLGRRGNGPERVGGDRVVMKVNTLDRRIPARRKPSYAHRG